MVGKNQLVLGPNEFVTGLASSLNAPDGWLDPVGTERANIFMTPGIFYGTGVGTDKAGGSTAGAFIASSEDSQTTAPVNRVLVNSSGYIYSYDGSTLTSRITSATRTYTFGCTDIAPFAGTHYVTSTTHLGSFNTSTWTYGNESLQAFNSGQDPHPLLVYEDLLFSGDGNLLKQLTAGGTFTTQLTLATTERITALGIDPGSGMMLISCAVGTNYSDTTQQQGIVYLHDGISAKPRRKILTESVIRAFHAHGGQVYCGVGQNIGIWNGSGVTYLRKLQYAGLVQNELPYKHHFASTGNLLHIADGHKVLTYGETIPGKKVFSYTFTTGTSSEKLNAICKVGNNELAVSYKPSSTMYFYVTPMFTAGTIGLFRSREIVFERPVYIRSVRLVTTGIPDTGAGSAGTVLLYDEAGDNLPKQTNSITNTTGASKALFDFEYGGAERVTALRVYVNIADQTYGIKNIYVYYDVAE